MWPSFSYVPSPASYSSAAAIASPGRTRFVSIPMRSGGGPTRSLGLILCPRSRPPRDPEHHDGQVLHLRGVGHDGGFRALSVSASSRGGLPPPAGSRARVHPGKRRVASERGIVADGRTPLLDPPARGLEGGAPDPNLMAPVVAVPLGGSFPISYDDAVPLGRPLPR